MRLILWIFMVVFFIMVVTYGILAQNKYTVYLYKQLTYPDGVVATFSSSFGPDVAMGNCKIFEEMYNRSALYGAFPLSCSLEKLKNEGGY